MSCCSTIEQQPITSPLHQINMNLSSLSSHLVTPPASPAPVGGSDDETDDENTYPTTQQQQRKQRRSVSFSPVVEIYTAPSPLDAIMRDDETSAWKHDLWFTMEDLAQFRDRARDLCRQMRSTDEQQQQPTLTTCSDPSTRGLEQRSCLERQRRKYIATRFILRAACQLKAHPNPAKSTEERLAAIARKCNSWATTLAIEEAARDYGRAYHDTDNVVVYDGACDVPSSLKRHLSSTSVVVEEATRRVRVRLA